MKVATSLLSIKEATINNTPVVSATTDDVFMVFLMFIYRTAKICDMKVAPIRAPWDGWGLHLWGRGRR